MRGSDGEHRDYGAASYWRARYAAGSKDDSHTDEWLLAWQQLQPLLEDEIERSARVVDLGCGTSKLCFDLLSTHLDEAGSVLALDNAPGAISELEREKARRVRRGEASASRATLRCMEAWDVKGCFDVAIDKSTTDGLLCDGHRGAGRVRRMYASVGEALSPRALVVVVSWRGCDDGLGWLLESAVEGLRQGSARGQYAGCRWCWSIDVHAPSDLAAAAAPHVYLVRRRPRRFSPRTAVRRHGEGRDEEQDALVVREHWH